MGLLLPYNYLNLFLSNIRWNKTVNYLGHAHMQISKKFCCLSKIANYIGIICTHH